MIHCTVTLITYNQEDYIRDAVESILQQECAPLEIIISDDASTDRTFDIINECTQNYCGKHRLIINRNEKNMGLSGHLNKLIGMSTGEWFIMAGGDDISLPNRCAQIMKAIKQHPEASGIVSDMEIIDAHNKHIRQECGWNINLKKYPSSLPWYRQFGKTCFIVPTGAASAWKKDLYTFAPLPSNRPCSEDILLTVRCHFLHRKIVHLPQVLVKWRHHGKNQSELASSDNMTRYEEELIRINKFRKSTLETVREDLMQLGLKTAPNSRKINSYLSLLIRQCDQLIRWWELPFYRRLFWVMESPRTWGFDVTVRIWHRLMSREKYLLFKKGKKRYSRF
ncbi:MAG: glycosyltransferase [Akkermansia sp.]